MNDVTEKDNDERMQIMEKLKLIAMDTIDNDNEQDVALQVMQYPVFVRIENVFANMDKEEIESITDFGIKSFEIFKNGENKDIWSLQQETPKPSTNDNRSSFQWTV